MYGEEMEQLISSIAHRCCRVTGLPNSPITKENQTERGVIALEAWTQNKEKRVASHTGGDGFADAYIYLSVFFFGGRQSVGPLFCRAQASLSNRQSRYPKLLHTAKMSEYQSFKLKTQLEAGACPLSTPPILVMLYLQGSTRIKCVHGQVPRLRP